MLNESGSTSLAFTIVFPVLQKLTHHGWGFSKMAEFVTLDNISAGDIFPDVNFEIFLLKVFFLIETFCSSEIVMVMINW